MADGTNIEWTDATWNPVTGCTVVSAGCTNCYAMKFAGTRLKHHSSRAGLTIDTKAGPVWNGTVRLNEEWLDQPLRWKRPRTIFVCAHGDLFHEGVPDEWLDRIFAIMALSPQHRFQVLTKRADRMRSYILAKQRNAPEWVSLGDGSKTVLPYEGGYPTNVWLGVSVENQAAADERIPHLLATPAAVRFLSCEPLLGPVDLSKVVLPGTQPGQFNALTGDVAYTSLIDHGGQVLIGPLQTPRLDWVIVGGESGPGARPMHPNWAKSLRDQCASAGVPFFFKQWGEWAPVCAMSEEQIDGCYHPAPERDPEASRRCKVKQCGLHVDGTRFDGQAMFRRPAFEQGSRAMTMMAIGKHRAGRLLDGVQHDGMPA